MARPKPLAFDADGLHINQAVFSRGGHFVAAVGGLAGGEGCLLVWDAATGRRVCRRPLARETGMLALFSPDGATLATCCHTDDQVTLWDTATWQARRHLRLIPENPSPNEYGLVQEETVTEQITFSADG